MCCFNLRKCKPLVSSVYEALFTRDDDTSGEEDDTDQPDVIAADELSGGESKQR